MGRRVGEESHVCSVMVDSGSTVSLYLNSDAHPSHRKEPVYGVIPADRDVFVRLTEKEGKLPDTAVPAFVKAKNDAAKEAALKELESAKANRETVSTQEGTTRMAWKTEVDATAPTGMTNFREALLGHGLVRQVLDPWYMDKNTRDEQAPVLNEQRSSLETLHANHLHITVSEPEILSA